MKKKIFSFMAAALFMSSTFNLNATSVAPKVDCILLAFELDELNPMTYEQFAHFVNFCEIVLN